MEGWQPAGAECAFRHWRHRRSRRGDDLPIRYALLSRRSVHQRFEQIDDRFEVCSIGLDSFFSIHPRSGDDRSVHDRGAATDFRPSLCWFSTKQSDRRRALLVRGTSWATPAGPSQNQPDVHRRWKRTEVESPFSRGRTGFSAARQHLALRSRPGHWKIEAKIFQFDGLLGENRRRGFLHHFDLHSGTHADSHDGTSAPRLHARVRSCWQRRCVKIPFSESECRPVLQRNNPRGLLHHEFRHSQSVAGTISHSVFLLTAVISERSHQPVGNPNMSHDWLATQCAYSSVIWSNSCLSDVALFC